jgi:hypothetical protein
LKPVPLVLQSKTGGEVPGSITSAENKRVGVGEILGPYWLFAVIIRGRIKISMVFPDFRRAGKIIKSSRRL